jgi:hypothetical protein
MRIEATTPLQGSSGSTATVFIRWPYSLYTFDRVLRRRAGFFPISLRPISHRALAAVRLRWPFERGDVLDGNIQPLGPSYCLSFRS